jgi:hypothetical protein
MCTSSKTGRDIDPLHLTFYPKLAPYAIPPEFIPNGFYALRHIFQKPLTTAFLFNYPQKNTTHLPEDSAHSRYLSNRPGDIVSVDANELDPDKRNQQVRLPADPRAREDNAITIFVAYKLSLFNRFLLRHKAKHSLKNKYCPWAPCNSIYPQ